MNVQSCVWSSLAALCVLITTASCGARLAALYRGPDLVTFADRGGDCALRALHFEEGNREWILSEFELDLEARLSSWAAAPRVAARASMAIGFLFAALSFRTILDENISAEDANGALLKGVLLAVAPVLWGMVGLAGALTTDRLARARVHALRRAGARLEALMCASVAGLSAHELGVTLDARVP